eukprot:3060544-Prymnesium_polylepis.1
MYSSTQVAPSLELAARERPAPWKELVPIASRDQICSETGESRDYFFLDGAGDAAPGPGKVRPRRREASCSSTILR